MNTPHSALPGGAAFGEFLRHARERRGLTLEQIASETKLPRRHLDALEEGNLAAVPGGTYLRGEIRAYAQAVHLDQGLALAQLERALEAAAAQAIALPTPGPAHARLRVLGYALVAMAVLAAASLVGGALWDGHPGPAESTQVPSVTDAAPAPDSAPAPHPAGQTPPTVSQTIGERTPLDQVAPPQGETNGELVVTTDPSGAQVTINGTGFGLSPITIRHLPFGPQRVRVTKEGFAPEDHVVQLNDRRPQRALNIALRTAP